MSSNLEKNIFNLKFTAKQLQRQSKKCQKDESSEKSKLKKAIQQGNTEGARIYAANAIRKKNESLNLLKLSSRIDAVVSRMETAVTMKKVSTNMVGVVKQMDKAMETMNLEQITAVMDRFEKQFEDLDVTTEYMEGAMSHSVAGTTPADEVDNLIQQVADEHGLEVKMALPGAVGTALPSVKLASKDDEELSERLSKLRNP